MLSWTGLSERSVIFTACRHGSGTQAWITPITITYFPRRKKAYGNVHIHRKKQKQNGLSPSEGLTLSERQLRDVEGKKAEHRDQIVKVVGDQYVYILTLSSIFNLEHDMCIFFVSSFQMLKIKLQQATIMHKTVMLKNGRDSHQSISYN